MTIIKIIFLKAYVSNYFKATIEGYITEYDSISLYNDLYNSLIDFSIILVR